MALLSATVTVTGRVAANVTDLTIDGTAVAFAEDGSYTSIVTVTTSDRVIEMITTTTDGMTQARYLTVRRDALIAPRAEV